MLIIFLVYTCTQLIMLTCLAAIPTHPFYIGEHDNNYDIAESLFDLDSMWFVRPQLSLFFHCTLLPIGTVAGRYNPSTKTFCSTWFSSVPLRNFA